MFLDHDHGARQAAFRQRLAGGEITCATVASPEELATQLLHALNELPHPDTALIGASKLAGAEARPGVAGRRVWTVPARLSTFVGRY